MFKPEVKILNTILKLFPANRALGFTLQIAVSLKIVINPIHLTNSGPKSSLQPGEKER